MVCACFGVKHTFHHAGTFALCVFWGLMCCQFFFGFGHQATVTSLRFEAAFVGLHGAVTGATLPLAGLLVGLNTLASHVRMAVC